MRRYRTRKISMHVLNDDLFLCSDCTQAAVNDDYSGISYHYTRELDVDQRIVEIKAGLEKLGPHLHPGDQEDEYSTRQCDCCGDYSGGRRQQFIQLAEGDYEAPLLEHVITMTEVEEVW